MTRSTINRRFANEITRGFASCGPAVPFTPAAVARLMGPTAIAELDGSAAQIGAHASATPPVAAGARGGPTRPTRRETLVTGVVTYVLFVVIPFLVVTGATIGA